MVYGFQFVTHAGRRGGGVDVGNSQGGSVVLKAAGVGLNHTLKFEELVLQTLKDESMSR